uniref:Uncharacterized protein n=1 Tax=Aegilops tauschii subsp. strangulata TaxID=200361 RepID=A0A453FFH3_AEGTS
MKLGLPGLVQEEPAASSREKRVHQESPALSLGYPPKHSTATTGAKRGFLDTVEAKAQGYEKEQARAAACGKELAVEENTAAVGERKKGCCPPPPPAHAPPATPARNIGNRPQELQGLQLQWSAGLQSGHSGETLQALVHPNSPLNRKSVKPMPRPCLTARKALL